VLGVALASVYAVAFNILDQQTKTRLVAERTAFARAMLDEYVATWPDTPQSGVYADIWEWRIEERPQPRLTPTALDRYFDFQKLTITVRDSGGESNLSTVIARRVEGS